MTEKAHSPITLVVQKGERREGKERKPLELDWNYAGYFFSPEEKWISLRAKEKGGEGRSFQPEGAHSRMPPDVVFKGGFSVTILSWKSTIMRPGKSGSLILAAAGRLRILREKIISRKRNKKKSVLRPAHRRAKPG